MSFSDHKITAFTHRIADLPDQPNLPANELKARFDSSPEELRQSLNAVCDEGDALTIRVDQHDTQLNQIAMNKFPDDTIKESNLHADLAAKLNGKAEQTALTAEAAAREDADDALDARLNTVETALPQKCEIYFGTYNPSSSDNTDHVYLGFQPKAVLMVCAQPNGSYVLPVQLATQSTPHQMITITASGFSVAAHDWRSSSHAVPYRYIAFK